MIPRRAVLPFALVAACTDPADPPAPTPLVTETPALRAMALGATPLSVDDHGRPRLMQIRPGAIAKAATPAAAAKLHVERLASAWGVSGSAMPVLEPAGDVRVSGQTSGLTIARLQPVIDGLPVEAGELRLLVRDSGELVTASGTLVGTDAPRSARVFADDESGAIARAVEHAYGAAFDKRALGTRSGKLLGGASAGVTVTLARARQVWHQVGRGLVAGWVVEYYATKLGTRSDDAYRTDLAADGSVLSHRSLVVDFDYRVFGENTGEKHPEDGPTTDATPHPTGTPDGSYPAYVASTVVRVPTGLNDLMDPWLPVGATETNGNNVDAYTDIEAPDGLSAGDFRANTTAPNVFGYAYNTAAEPMATVNQQKAVVVSLFYVINWLHDFWYDAGFTEAAGNGQAMNYGRGGVEGDPLRAEAQDNANAGNRNNANMSTPSDGMPPRMQVYLWTGKDDRTLRLAPSNRMPAVNSASFGPTAFDVSALVQLANPVDACTPIAPATGRVVLVDRGACTFKLKALNVQNAGGVAMLLANNVAGDQPPGMGPDAAVTQTITIGSLSITQAEGNQIKSELGVAVTATLHRKAGVELDGGLDSTLIAHEFGHYLHHRLSNCNTRMCSAISEGWGDFLAIMMMVRDGDNFDGAYPFSIYTTQSFTSDPAYFGIRRAPYSTNFAINSLSFRHVSDGEPLPTTHPFLGSGNNAEVHNAGEVFTAALWQGFAAMLKAGPFVEARQRMAEYVVAGLLMTPVDATFVEARDAILAAAHAANPADHDLLARGFAERGMGSCAISPGRDSVDFVGVVESTEIKGRASPGAPTIEDTVRSCDNDGILDGGETAKIRFPIANPAAAPVENVTVTLSSETPGVTVLSQPVAIANLAAYQSQDLEFEVQLDNSSSQAVAGELAITISSPGICFDSVPIALPLRMNVDDNPERTAIDRFNAVSTLWTPVQTGPRLWFQARTTSLNGHWHGDDAGSLADSALVSPVLTAGSGKLVIAFQHRHSFEVDAENNYDGGVIEVAVDGGDWLDVSNFADPGYTGPLTDISGNPLANREAFAGESEGYPNFKKVTLDFGTQFAGKTFQIRFRIGTDQAAGGPGWDLDDVEFHGISGKPFPNQDPDSAPCALPGDEDGGCCDAGPLSTQTAMLALGLLALLLRRKRR